MDLPKISIITPSYNQAAYLETTIRSVLSQAYPDLEYIVIDGGSEDGSVEILQRYDSDLAYWVSEKDDGQTDAINKGLRRATGEVVAYLNSDDQYLPGALQTVGQTFATESGECQWCAGAVDLIDTSGTVVRHWPPQAPPENAWWLLTKPWTVPQVGAFWRRSLHAQHGYFRTDMHYGLDTEWFIRLAIHGCKPTLLKDTLGLYLLHEESKTLEGPLPFWKDMLRYFDLYQEHVPPEDHWRAQYRLGQIRLDLALRQGQLGTAVYEWCRLLGMSPIRTLGEYGRGLLFGRKRLV